MPRIAQDTVALIAVCLAGFLFGLEISAVPVTLPTVRDDLGGSFATTEWIVGAYTLAVAAVLMPAGALADRFGRRRLLTGALVGFAIASLGCGLAPSPGALIAGRALQGAAGGVLMSSQLAVLSHQFTDATRRARAFGTWGIVFGAGLGFGPLLGALAVDVVSWRWVYLVNVALAPVAIALLRRGATESRDPDARRVDVPGMVTLVAAVLGLVVWITEGPRLGFASASGLAILAAAVLALGAFVAVERTTSQPLLDVGLFRIRAFSGALLGSAGMNFSFWPLIVYLPTYLQDDRGASPIGASAILLFCTLPTLVLPPLAERLTLRHRAGTVIPAGLMLIGAGLIALRLGATTESWVALVPGLALAGSGLGITNTPVTNTTTGSVPPARAGLASGLDMSARMVSLAVNIAVMGLLYTTYGFGAVTIYGAVAVMLLAAASRVVTAGVGRPVGAGRTA